MRFGVVRPDPDADEPPSARATPPIMSGMLSVVGEGVSDGVSGAEDCFMDDCLGTKGFVEDVWVPLVYRREMEAVAVDVLEEGAGAGVRGWNPGGRSREPSFLASGRSTRILRRDWTVSIARQLSSDEDDDGEDDISRIVGHQWTGGGGDGGETGRLGVTDREREVFDPGRVTVRSGELRFLEGEHVALRSVLVLAPEPRRLRVMKRGELVREEETDKAGEADRATKEESLV